MGGGFSSPPPPQTCSAPPPDNILDDEKFPHLHDLEFRVRPRACYVKGTMKRQKSIYSKFI